MLRVVNHRAPVHDARNLPPATRLRNNMAAVITAYCEATGTKDKRALVKVVGSLTPRNILLDPEADMKAGK